MNGTIPQFKDNEIVPTFSPRKRNKYIDRCVLSEEQKHKRRYELY